MLSKPADDRAFAHPRLLLAVRASATPTTQTVVAFGEGGRRSRAPDSFSESPSLAGSRSCASRPRSIRSRPPRLNRFGAWAGWLGCPLLAGASNHPTTSLDRSPLTPRLLAASSSIARPPHLHAHLHQTRTLTSLQSTEFTGCEDVHARGRGFQARPGGGAPFRQGKSDKTRSRDRGVQERGGGVGDACMHTYIRASFMRRRLGDRGLVWLNVDRHEPC